MRTVAALCRGLTADSRPDGELLAVFATARDEAALTELVRRHGTLVWGTCRRLLHDPADAEDAFQAAFLVLVRRAGQLARYSCVGPWLYRVTVLTAKNVRRKNARRFAKQAALPAPDHVPGPSTAPDPDLKADLDAALLALPSRYRDPIVLCHLLGFTRREAAERLGCPEGTLSGWLNRGLAKLRDRLRGLDPSKALAGGAVAVPAVLCASTARAAVASAVASASVNPTVSLLVEGVLRMFWVQKATATAVALCAVFALGVGIGLGTRTDYSGATAQEKGPEKAAGGPNAVDNATLIASLERDIVELERFREKVASAAQDVTEMLAKRRPGSVPPTGKSGELQSAEEILTKLQEHLKATDADLASAKARLAKLKGGAKPGPAKSAASALNDIFGKPTDLEAAVLQSQATVEVATVDYKIAVLLLKNLENESNAKEADLRAAKAGVEKGKAGRELALKNFQFARSRLAAARAMHAPPLKALGACIEVVVVDGPAAPGVCRVREYGRGGALVGSVLAEDAKALELILSRALKDPAGPRDFWLVVSADHAPDAIVRAAKAGKAAGFTQVKLKGAVPDGLEATKALSEREFNGASFDLSKFAP